MNCRFYESAKYLEQWVWKKQGHNYKYLPRRHDGIKKYDFVAENAGPDNFPERLDGNPPKLWLAWLYRDLRGEPKWVGEKVRNLFGEDFKVGKMEVFKNTASVNHELWHIKHLIDLKPLTFPNGEPTMEDVKSLEVFHDGRCVVDKEISCEDSQITVIDRRKQWTPAELSGRLSSRYAVNKDVFEDTVYNPANMSIID
ncbi:unnamed protein product [Enterobius vermicularis]|uniref:NADH dehydrogenase [ubiquinone] 1 alpha subcomplex subunit 12 n=1 Tax=Enterobius vermicularis TaxID=51028 RepID=A0A0N4VE70_ENTVE|nr:unnamed protein product [Enterobius vermicularis]